MNDMVSAIPYTEFCPIFTPFLMASNVHPNAKACFIGISNYHTRAHLMRGVYEGIAFCHRHHFEKLMKSRTTPLDCIRLAGGVARSIHWGQIFADVMGYPIEVMDVNETGTLGCAINAAVAVGDFASLQQAARSMTKARYRLKPDPSATSVYDKKYHLYCTILEATDRIWDELTTLL